MDHNWFQQSPEFLFKLDPALTIDDVINVISIADPYPWIYTVKSFCDTRVYDFVLDPCDPWGFILVQWHVIPLVNKTGYTKFWNKWFSRIIPHAYDSWIDDTTEYREGHGGVCRYV